MKSVILLLIGVVFILFPGIFLRFARDSEAVLPSTPPAGPLELQWVRSANLTLVYLYFCPNQDRYFLSPTYCSSFQNQKHWYNHLRTKFLCFILFLP